MSTNSMDPYHRWLGIPPEEQPPHHYRLLGLTPFESDVQVIESAADRQMAHLRRYQAGEYAAEASRLLNEVSRARLCLLKPAARETYDAKLQLILADQVVARSVSQGSARKRTLLVVGVGSAMALVVGAVSFAVFSSARGLPSQADSTKAGPAVPARAGDSPVRNGSVQVADKSAVAPVPSRTGSTPVEGAPPIPSGKLTAVAAGSPVSKKDKVPETRQPGRASAGAVSRAAGQPNEVADTRLIGPGKQGPAARTPASEPEADPAGPGLEMPQDGADLNDADGIEGLDTSDDRLAPPDDGARAQAREQIRNDFKAHYTLARKANARNQEPRRTLARELYAQAQDNSLAPERRYVLFDEALDLANDAGELELALEVIERFSLDFQVEAPRLKHQALKSAKPSLKTLPQSLDWVNHAVRVMTAARKKNDYDVAAAVVQDAMSVARKLPALRDQIAIHSRQIAQCREAYAQAQAARTTLQNDPHDPAAATVWGRYLGLYQRRWSDSFRLLARGDHPDLARVAQRELAASNSAEELEQLGDDWWTISESETSPAREAARERALRAWRESKRRASPSKQLILNLKMIKVFENSELNEMREGDPGLVIGAADANPGPTFTAEFWIATESQRAILLSKRHLVAETALVISLNDGELTVGRDSPQGFHFMKATTNICDGQFHHVAVVKAGKRIQLFVDGTADGTLEVDDSFRSKTPWKLGRQETAANYPAPAARFLRIRLSREARYWVDFQPEWTYDKDKSTLLFR